MTAPSRVTGGTLPACRKISSARNGTAVIAFLGALLMSAGHAEEAIRGPDVTIIASEERTVFEYSQNGHVRMIKVVPKIGKPYFLVPADNTTGETDLVRSDMLLPSWKIIEF